MITVHLSQAGTKHFGGTYAQAKAAAEGWIREQARAARAAENDEDKVGQERINARSWLSYCSPRASRVFRVMKEATRPLTTLQVAGIAGVSREAAQRILSVMEIKGEAHRAGEVGRGRTSMWEATK